MMDLGKKISCSKCSEISSFCDVKCVLVKLCFGMYHDLFKCLSCAPSDIMNNKVFYQHPNLMRVLGMHETVMEVMVNVLGGDKSQVTVTALPSLVNTS